MSAEILNGLAERADFIHTDLDEMRDVIGGLPSNVSQDSYADATACVQALDKLRRSLAWNYWVAQRRSGR